MGGVEGVIYLLQFLLCDNILTNLARMGMDKGKDGMYVVNKILCFEGGVTASGWQVIRIMARQFHIDPEQLFNQLSQIFQELGW